MLRESKSLALCRLRDGCLQQKSCVFRASLRFLNSEATRNDEEAALSYAQSPPLCVQSSGDTHRREAWREWLTADQLQRIDTLTYLLGRYPPTEKTTNATSDEHHLVAVTKQTEKDVETSLPVTLSPTSQLENRTLTSSRPKAPLSLKKKKLVALNARALPTKDKPSSVKLTSSPASSCVSAFGQSTAFSARRLWAQNTFLSSSSRATPVVEKRPYTDVAVVEQLARQWLRKSHRLQVKQAKIDEAEQAAWQALLEHPTHLFADDAAVYARFGMGAYVSPNLPGFSGLFRQRWQDFHVTEMATPSKSACKLNSNKCNSKTSASPSTVQEGMFCDAVPVSRDFDFSIPPLPSKLLSGSGKNLTDGKDTKDDVNADISFFAVDVRQRIQELQAEEVPERNCAAVAAVLAKEKQHNTTAAATTPVGESIVDNDEIDEECGANFYTDTKKTEATKSRQTLSTHGNHRHTINNPNRSPDDCDGGFGSGHHFLQCTLHKQHVAHGNALAAIAQTLRIHPRSISVAGIKDYIGDTVQRVRLENVSPASALAANRHFRQKGLKMTLSDFSYEPGPLSPGDLFGNHFRIVLRDVDVPKSDLVDAIAAFAEKGFPNYYGCQRFSWFAGRQDAAFALLRHNWLAFAFLFLNYTGKDFSLRELLQRPKKYPHPAQDEYRRGVVRRLRAISVEPADLDVVPFLSCPTLNTPLTHADGRPFSEVEELICAQLREAYFDLNVQSRRLTAQRLSSYLWNQVLTLRLHHIGGEKILDGDLVAPASIRQLSTNVSDRQDWYQTFGDSVSSENRHHYTIEDVVHPGFSFDAIVLPQNVVGAYYEQICGKYALDWMTQHSRTGLRDFREPPRPIIRKPLNLSYEYNVGARTLTLCFALERGCYANVALSELMKSVRCLGSEEVTLLPLPDAMWDALGEADRGYVTTLQDIYEGYEDGVGFMNDASPVERAGESETKVWDHVGPLFHPSSEDPFRKAHRWGSQHLLRNSERREKEAEDMKRLLFDRPLAKQLREGEVDTYAGHIVPLPPNASAKAVYAKVMRRKRRYTGSPKMTIRIRRSTSPGTHHGGVGNSGFNRLPSFQSLNKNSWNFTW